MTSKADESAIEIDRTSRYGKKNLISLNLPSLSNSLKIFRKSQEVSFVFPWKWVTNGCTPLSLAIVSQLSLKWNVNIKRSVLKRCGINYDVGVLFYDSSHKLRGIVWVNPGVRQVSEPKSFWITLMYIILLFPAMLIGYNCVHFLPSW